MYETEIRSASREEDNNFTGEPSSPGQEYNQLCTSRSRYINMSLKTVQPKQQVIFSNPFSSHKE